MDNETAAQSLAELRQLATRFLPAAEVVSLTFQKPPTTGFSGSPVWLLACQQTGPRYVLKQLPAAVPPAQIAWSHGLAFHLAAAELTQVPVPLPLLTSVDCAQTKGRFAVDAAGQYWQCLPFRPGRAIAIPTPSNALTAVTCLARLHQAAAGFRMAMSQPRQTGWQRRISQLTQLAHEGLAGPPAGVVRHSDTLSDASARLLRVRSEAAAFLATIDCQQLASRLDGRWCAGVVQPVLRDCWWAHLLFETTADDSRVTGIIDLDAAGIDTPAVDVARLLGSWQLEAADPSPPLAARWPQAVQRYVEICRPAGDFPADIQVLHDTAVICGLDRWCRWLFSEGREFPDLQRVAARLEGLLRALPAAITRRERV
jgi:Ser/Thr protein kinase RdoA (MazF antagonist)